MKTISETDFFDEADLYLEEAQSEPIEIALVDSDSVVLISKKLFDAFMIETGGDLP